MNAPANISFEDRLKARYAAAKAQTFPTNLRARIKAEPAPSSKLASQKPAQKRREVDERAHMEAHHVWRAWRGAPMSPQQYFVAACWLAGYTPEIIRSASRTRPIAAARRAIIRSLAQRFPKLSSNAMEPIVNRDHTSILYCMGQTKRGNAMTGGSVRERSDQFKQSKGKGTISEQKAIKDARWAA